MSTSVGPKNDPTDFFHARYEATAWGMTATTWQKIQNVIFLADRPNVKHCLDTYHIAAIVSGHVNSPQTGFLKKNSTQLIKNDMGELKKCIKKGDIGYFQLSDAQGVDLEQKGYPLVDLNQPDNMTWSRNCRNYPFVHLSPSGQIISFSLIYLCFS